MISILCALACGFPLVVADVMPVLREPQALAGNGWRLAWTGETGRIYRLERTTQLQGAATIWDAVAAVTAGNGIISVDDLLGPASVTRFYRVVVVPSGPLSETIFSPAGEIIGLGGDGLPKPGAIVRASSDGTLPPFQFQPGGKELGITLRFPNGARLVAGAPSGTVEFTKLELAENLRGVFRPGQPLVFQNPAPTTLILGELPVQRLIELFAPGTNGLPLKIFGRFPVRALDGTIGAEGFHGTRFVVELAGLPLPPAAGGYPEFIVELTANGAVRIPLHGEWTLPDGSGTAPQARLGVDRPAWLEMRPNGEVAMDGRASVIFPGGPQFTADVHVGDSVYALQFAANNLQANLLAALASFLPPVPAVPAGASAAQLDLLADTFGCLDRAYGGFGAATMAVAPADGTTAPPAPSRESPSSGNLLDAWVCSALAAPRLLSLAPLRAELEQNGNSAAGGSSLEQALERQAALLRVRQALRKQALLGDGAVEIVLDDALRNAVAAAILRAREPGTIASLGDLNLALASLLEIQKLLQEVGGEADAILGRELTGAMEDLLRDFGYTRTVKLGILAGQFTPGSTVAALDRAAVMMELRQTLEYLRQSQLLGVNLAGAFLQDEMLSQLALQGWRRIVEELNEAEAGHDAASFSVSVGDAQFIGSLTAAGFLPVRPELAELPGQTALENLLVRLDALLQISGQRPPLLGSIPRVLAEPLRRLRASALEINSRRVFYERLYGAVQPVVDNAGTRLGELTPAQLVQLLAAGLRFDELAAFLGRAAEWQSLRLPAVVDRLKFLAQQRGAAGELRTAVQALLEAMSRAGLAGRTVFLQQSALLLESMRQIALARWNVESARRAAGPAADLADAFLPGNVYVDDIAGSIRYDSRLNQLSGAFRGNVRLPRFGASFALDNASLSGGGAFELSLHGGADFPPGAAPVGHVEVPPRHPLQISFAPPSSLHLSGGLRVALKNGFAFEGFADLADPNYRFGVSASGLNLNLGKSVLAALPFMPVTNTVSDETARLLNLAHRHAGSTLENQASTGFPLIRQPGVIPQSSAARASQPMAALLAWGYGNASARALGLANIPASSNQVSQIFDTLSQPLSGVAEASAQTSREEAEAFTEAIAAFLARPNAVQGISANQAATGGLGEEDKAALAAKLARDYDRIRARLAEPATTNEFSIGLDVLREAIAHDLTAQRVNLAVPMLESEARLAIDKLRRVQYPLYGLNPFTGSVSNKTRFESISSGNLLSALGYLGTLSKLAQGLFSTGGLEDDALVFQEAYVTVQMRRRLLFLRELRALPADAFEQQLEKIYAIATIMEEVAAGRYDYPPGQERLNGSTGTITLLTEQSDYEPILKFAENSLKTENRLFTLLRHSANRLILLDRLIRKEITPAFQEQARGEIQRLFKSLSGLRSPIGRIGAFQAQTDPPVIGDPLDDLQAALGGLQWGDANKLPDVASLAQQIIPLLAQRLATAAVAERAWWKIAAFNDALLAAAAGSSPALATVCRASVPDLLRANDQILRQLGASLTGAPLDLQLPGQLTVRRVFGAIEFNRVTGFIKGSFGGRVEFPELNEAWFDLSEATLDSDLNFRFVAGTHGFRPISGVRLNLPRLVLAGGRAGLAEVSGQAQISFNNGPAFDASLRFDGATHELSFDAAASSLQTLRFSDDAVFFNANAGFTLRPAAQSGELRVGGAAGLFRKDPSSALGNNIVASQFHLSASNLQTVARFDATGRAELALTNGTLRLPDFFYTTNLTVCGPAGQNEGAGVRLLPSQPVALTYTGGTNGTLELRGALEFRQFGFGVPGFNGLEAGVCSATLLFPGKQLPYLTNVNASLRLPIPQQTNYVDLTNAVFRLDGFPFARIQLRNNLTLVDAGGFKIQLLGLNTNGCLSSGLTISPGANSATAPTLLLDGGLKVSVPTEMLVDTVNGEVCASACGGLKLVAGQLPELINLSAAFTGTFRLGAGGPLVRDASLALVDLQNLFQLAPDRKFTLALGGTLGTPAGLGFTLRGARFEFDSPNRLPEFFLTSIGVDARDFLLMQALPIQLSRAELAFRNPRATLPERFASSNLTITASGKVAIPPENPVLEGALENLSVSFRPDGLPQLDGVSTVCVGVQSFEIPPLNNLGGKLCIGGFDGGGPASLWIAGRLNGDYQGYRVVVQTAMTLAGLLGVCVDVNAGSAGVPLGPTGFLWTGAQGGFSLGNNGGDPCAFSSYLRTNALGEVVGLSGPLTQLPSLPWPDFRSSVAALKQRASQFAGSVSVPVLPRTPGMGTPVHATSTSAGSGLTIDCPGDCPPATVNIFCQPHPDQVRFPGIVIAKFSSVDEATLNQIGITRSSIQGLGANAATVAATVAGQIVTFVGSVTPTAGPPLSPVAIANLNTIRNTALQSLRTTLSGLIQSALGTQAAGAYYDQIVRVAYAGVPCPDLTLSVAGNFSYTGVSTFGYVQGKGIVSSTGNAGVIGTAYILGVPVGEAEVFVAATDANGDPNPSLCGGVEFSLGPLALGQMRLNFECPGCMTEMVRAFGNIVNAGVSDPLLKQITARAASPETAALARTALLGSLTSEQKLAILGQLASLPPGSLPVDFPRRFVEALGGSWSNINPSITFCGEVAPKLFGIPLLPSGNLVRVAGVETKHRLDFELGFPPSAVLSYFFPILPPSDQATLGFSFSYPNAYDFLFGGFLGGFSSPEAAVAYTRTAVDFMLENSSTGIRYEFHPLGLKVADAAGRVIIPDLLAHPERYPVGDSRRWRAPEALGIPGLPSREQLLLTAASAGVLGNVVSWKGLAGDLAALYPANSPERNALASRALRSDYFPHGGMAGAGRLSLPRIITDKPPFEDFALLSNPATSLTNRLAALARIVQDYVLTTRTNGEIAFYIPAPNPPVLFNGNGTLKTSFVPSSALEVLDSIKSVTVDNLAFPALWSTSQAFVNGFLNAELLGMPIGKAKLRAIPPADGRTGILLAEADALVNSWLAAFLPSARFQFELRQTPTDSVEKIFERLASDVQSARTLPSQAAAVIARGLDEFDRSLPKVKLEAEVSAPIPPPANLIATFTRAASLYAYSPRYEPGFEPANTSPAARIRREGGIAVRGSLDFRVAGATIVNVSNAELSVTPQSSGAPAVAGQFVVPEVNLPPLKIRNAQLDFSSVPNPRWSARGGIAPINIVLFAIEPLTGTELAGQLDVSLGSAAGSQGALFLTPSRLRFGPFATTIRGASPGQNFGFSTSGPWSATLDSGSALKLTAGNITIIEFQSTGLISPITVSGNGLTSAQFSAGVGGGSILDIFPGQPYAQRLQTSPGLSATVTVRSDGTFVVSGTLGQDLKLNGLSSLPIGGLKSGATFTLTQNSLNVSGRLNGGLLEQLGGPAFDVGGTFDLSRSGTPSFNADASVSIDPIGTSQISVRGVSSDKITGVLSTNGIALSGARLVVAGILTNNALPPFTMNPKGDFTLQQSPSTSTFGPYSFGSLSYTLFRSNGIVGITNLHAVPSFPGLSLGLSLDGYLAGNGQVDLKGGFSGGNLGGYPLASITGAVRRASSAGVSAVITAHGPLAYWQLNESKGTIAVSQTSSKFDGTYQTGATPGRPGAFGGNNSAVEFDGKGGQITIGNESLFDGIGEGLTLEAWFKVNTLDRTWNTLLAKGDTTWRLQTFQATGSLRFDTDGVTPPYLEATRRVNDGQWHHVMAIYDGQNKYLWIDGQLNAWTPASGVIAKNDFPVAIGENSQATGRNWNGLIDEAVIYNRALNPAEVLEHFQAGGGLVFSVTSRLNLGPLGAIDLDGTLGGDGAFALSATPGTRSIAGFDLGASSFRFIRARNGVATLFAAGDLAVPGLPATRLAGTVSSAGVVNLTANPGNGRILAFDFTNLALQVTGSVSGASLRVQGDLGVTGLGSLNFNGVASSNGEFSLTNIFNPDAPLFNIPMRNRTLVFERRLTDYAVLLRGDSFIANDRGDNPTAYWRLGETSGTTAADSKKTGFLITLNPGTYIGGVVLGQPGILGNNTAARFDGVDDYVTIPNSSNFALTKSLTMEAWIKIPAWTAGRAWQAILTKGDSSWRLSRYSTSRTISFDTTSSEGSHSLPAVRDIDDNQWHYVVAVYDGIAKYLYVDGLLEGFQLYDKALNQNSSPVMIGENAEARGRYFNGWMDEVAVYASALSSGDIVEHYLAGGGALLLARAQLNLPGIQNLDLSGFVQPNGGAALQASASSIGLVGFSIKDSKAMLTKLPGLQASVAFAGRVETVLGNAVVAGTSDSFGNYTLYSAPSGSLTVGGRTFNYASALELTRNSFAGNGSLEFGLFKFAGSAKLTGAGAISFSGSTSGDSGDFKAFGVQLNGQPGHPYAKLSWKAGASYDQGVIKASLSGTLTVEYESSPNKYTQQDFTVGPFTLPATGLNLNLVPDTIIKWDGLFKFSVP